MELRTWYVDGHMIFAVNATDALAEVKRLYDHEAEIVRPWTGTDVEEE